MITEDLTITVPCPCALIVHRKSGDKMYDEVVIPSWRKSRSKKSPRIVFTTIKLSPEGAEIKLLSPNPLTIAIEISKQLYRFSVSSLLYPEQRETAWKNISAKAIVSMYLTAYRYNSTAAAPLVFKDIETDVWHNIITKEVRTTFVIIMYYFYNSLSEFWLRTNIHPFPKKKRKHFFCSLRKLKNMIFKYG